MGMATLGVEHARRKHAAQLAKIFSDIVLAVSVLRCRLAFQSPQSDTEMKTFTDGDEAEWKTQLHELYMRARSSLNQCNAHTTRNLSYCACLCWESMYISTLLSLDSRRTWMQHVYHDNGDAKLSVGDEVVWTTKHKLRLKGRHQNNGDTGTVCAIGSSSISVRFDALRPEDVDKSTPTLVFCIEVGDPSAIKVDDRFTLEAEVSCPKIVVGKGTTGSVLAVQGDHVYVRITQDKDKLGAAAVCVERKNVCALAGCIPRRWEVAADFASNVTELLLGT